MTLTSGSSVDNHRRIDNIPGISDLWMQTKGDNRICIAVIDSNIDYTHPGFEAAEITTVNLFNSEHNSSEEPASLEHGTSVASIIFGQHQSSIKGLAPGCRGIIIPAFRNRDNGIISCSQIDLARAIQAASQNGANIINISGGEFSASGKPEPMLEETIQKCVKKGILIISAAGNDGCECLHVPAAANSVLAVGAMDENNEPMGFSNWGKAYKNNGLLFHGSNIPVALPGNETALKSGTSFATAVASGIAGLLMSLLIQHGHRPDGKLVFNALINTAFRCNEKETDDCSKVLSGRVNVAGAVSEILASSGYAATNYLKNVNNRTTIPGIKEITIATGLLTETAVPHAETSYITSKKKIHLWNKLTVHNLQLI